MRRRFTATLTVVVFATMPLVPRSALSAQVRDKAEATLKAAIDKEVLEGDLKSAIQQYKKLAESKDRSVAVKALIRMADCYQKLGDAESRKIYERVVKDYPDQKDAATLARLRLGGGNTSTGMNTRLLWRASKDILWNVGTVSLDGRYVSSAAILPEDLAIHDFATNTDLHIADHEAGNGKTSGSPRESAISKDGKRVAYQRCDGERCELRLANLTGAANPQHLYENPDIAHLAPFDWAPDGKSVAVQVERKDHTMQLGLVSVPDGRLDVLKSVDWRGAGRLFFSPDGRWLGFDLPENSVSPERDVFVLSVDGSREIHAVDYRGDDEMASWSPDGKWLLFFSRRTGSRDLWAIPFTGGSLGSPQLLKAGFERSTPLGMTTSGALYYIQETGGGPSRIQIASVDIAAEKVSAPVELPQWDSARDPAWSPDGKRLAYVSVRDRPASTLLVIRSNETGPVRELQPNLSYFRLDSWAPGGRSLLIHGADLKGQFGFYLVDAETGELQVLDRGLDVGYNGVKWAPDGRSFLVETNGSRPALYRVDVGTGDASEIMPFPPGQPALPGLYPGWFPDGKRIYYRRVFIASQDGRPTGEEAIVERNLSSGAERELARGPRLILPKLTSDGQYIVAVSLESNSRVLLLIPISGGQPRELLRVPPEVGLSAFLLGSDSSSLLVLKQVFDFIPSDKKSKAQSHTELWLVPLGDGEPKKIDNVPTPSTSVSPDGRHVAYTVSDPGSQQTTELWALENFLPKAVTGR
jgi:Tol biopolymer transport system component